MIRSSLEGDPSRAAQAIASLNALASGTFLYVGIVDTFVGEFESPRSKNEKFGSMAAGMLAVVVLSTMLHRNH